MDLGNGFPLVVSLVYVRKRQRSADAKAPLWSEVHSIELDRGYFSVRLGDLVPFGGVFDGSERFLGITVEEMLEAYVELDASREELTSDGFEPEVVERALGMIDRAEFKRRQAPPGVKLRPKAFGRDRRLPITNRFGG